MLSVLAVDGYRSLRSLVLPLAPLTVVTGANGSGKSSLYRSLRLLAAASRDGAIGALAREGGLPSTLWAGPEGGPGTTGTRRQGPVALRLGIGGDDLGYSIEFGHPISEATSFFALDPEIKVEAIWNGPLLRPASLFTERRGPSARVRTDDGWQRYEPTIAGWSSVLAEVADPRLAPEVYALRERMRRWRFYDHVRTDQDAPARQPSIGTRTPVVASDWSDLAAALQTIREQGDSAALEAAVDRGLPGSRIEVRDSGGRFELHLRQPGLLRPLAASELSDGTLRYLLWVAALMSTRPAPLLVLNEPETSLHPALLEPLGELIASATRNSQVIVVSHSDTLVSSLPEVLVHELEKVVGETRVVGQGMLDAPPWQWAAR